MIKSITQSDPQNLGVSERLGENQTRREAAQLYENVTLGSDNKVKKCDADDVVTYHDLEVLLYFQF